MRTGAAALAGLALAATFAVVHSAPTAEQPAAQCMALTYSEAYADMPALWSAYLGRGWVGSQTDGTDDRIYSPACF